MLCLLGDIISFGELDLCVALESLFHLFSTEARFVQGVLPIDQVVSYDAGSPHVRFLHKDV